MPVRLDARGNYVHTDAQGKILFTRTFEEERDALQQQRLDALYNTPSTPSQNAAPSNTQVQSNPVRDPAAGAVRLATLGASDYLRSNPLKQATSYLTSQYPFAAGLVGSAGRGATFGFSDYLNNDLKQASSKFADQYPITSGVAQVLGTLGGMATGVGEAGLAGHAAQIAARGVEALAPGLLERVAAKTVVPASKVVSNLPGVSAISRTFIPAAAKAAAQGWVTAYNTSDNDDPDPIGRANNAAILSSVFAPLANLGVSGVNGLTRAVGPSVNQAIRKTLKTTGLNASTLGSKLSELSDNARVYDVDPTALGGGGILSNIARVYPQLTPTIRNTAAEDIANIGAASQGLTQQYLGDTLHGKYTEFENAANNVKRQAATQLYGDAAKVPIDLSSHPDLLDHYIAGNDFSDFLNKARSSASISPATSARAERFLANRAQATSAAEDAVRGLDPEQIGDDNYNKIYKEALSNHIANNNLNLTLPNHLIQDYIDDVARNRPSVSQQYTRLNQNPVNDATLLADTTSRALEQVSPEYARAQEAYRTMSIPSNQAGVARNLTTPGTQGTRLDSEIADDFIARNAELVQRAQAAGVPDYSRPLNRYVLDESILKSSGGDPAKTPSAILKTIDPFVKPRLESVFGEEPINNLVDAAKRSNQYINNRGVLSSTGTPNDGNTGTMVDLPIFIRNLDKAFGWAQNFALQKRDTALMNFLQQRPQEALAHINEYARKYPNGTQEGFRKYINSAIANYSAASTPATYVDPGDTPHWDANRSRYWNGVRWTTGNDAQYWSGRQNAR